MRKSTRGSSREDGGFRAESVSGRVGREGEKGDGCRNACPPVVGPFARIPCGPSMSPLFLNLAVRIQIRSFRIGRGRRGEKRRRRLRSRYPRDKEEEESGFACLRITDRKRKGGREA